MDLFCFWVLCVSRSVKTVRADVQLINGNPRRIDRSRVVESDRLPLERVQKPSAETLCKDLLICGHDSGAWLEHLGLWGPTEVKHRIGDPKYILFGMKVSGVVFLEF